MTMVRGASISEVAKVLEDADDSIDYATSLLLAFALSGYFIMVPVSEVEIDP